MTLQLYECTKNITLYTLNCTVYRFTHTSLGYKDEGHCDKSSHLFCLKKKHTQTFRNFSGGPEIKTSPSSAGDASSIPGQRVKIPLVLGQKKHKHKIGAIL